MDTHGPEQHQHLHEHGDHSWGDESDLVELLDLDAEVLGSVLTDLTGRIAELTATRPPRRILDLGTGTGAGTLALLQRFTSAEAVAVDQSARFLQHLEDKAQALGLADRVHTLEADLDGPWPDLGGTEPPDLVWASASLHHLAEPDRVLADVHGALAPGGRLVAVELDSFPRFLPDDIGLGRPGLEARCHAALAEQRAIDMPHLGDDWGARLTRAGFSEVAVWPIAVDLMPPLPPAAPRYAQLSLRRVRSGLARLLSDDDLDTLDTVVESAGPEGVLQRTDLTVRATRTVWLGRRT